MNMEVVLCFIMWIDDLDGVCLPVQFVEVHSLDSSLDKGEEGGLPLGLKFHLLDRSFTLHKWYFGFFLLTFFLFIGILF